MDIILSFNAEIEKGLMARAQERGLTLAGYLQEIVARKASLTPHPESRPIHERFNNLSDLLLSSPFAGANLDLDDVTIVTRNTKDFEGIGATTINPWESA